FTLCPSTTPSTPVPTTPPMYRYMLFVELNSTDVTAVEKLRNINYPISINSNTQISDVNISTVCSPSNPGYQCRCEDQYRWSCDQCLTYGSCDNITDDTCGCISDIPADGWYCQSLDQYNFTACPPTSTTVVPTNATIMTTPIAAPVTNSTPEATTFTLINVTTPVTSKAFDEARSL
ncbi:hypothetical protein GOODEAATRI_027404, partial [Goodea atripinnis]